MKTKTYGFTARASITAARVALIATALAAYTDRAVAQSAQELAKPASTVEVGLGDVSQGSYKAGEYNGLENKGVFSLGNLDLRGGASFDSASMLRWRIKGTDLGLETRSLSAEVGVPGKLQLNFGYDELRRNRSDGYQTPYNGAGTNVLTLPGTWRVPTVAGSGGANPVSARGLVPAIGDAPYISTAAANNGALVSPTAAQMALVNAAASADVPLFHNVNLFTKRTRYDAGFAVSLDDQWALDANFRPEHKDGLKPMGSVSRNSASTGGNSLGDISTVIPDLVDNDHNQINTNLNFKGTKSFAQVGYYGSFFKNNVPFMSWQNWATGPAGSGTVNTISTAPDNIFNQVNASGGYNFTSATRLVVNGSYARNTQNDSFITNPTTPVVPVSSLNGLVVSTAFNARLTSRPTKKLALNAAYKYDDRDNRTAIHIFQFADAEETPVANANFPAGPNNPYGAVVAQNANANRPYSKKLNQFDFDADYAVAKGQWIKGGYDFERIARACSGSWISCTDAAVTNENTLRAEWRATVGEDFSARVDYALSERRAPNYNENAFLALVPYANVIPVGATGGQSAYAFMIANGWNGWGPKLGFGVTTGNMNLFFPNNNALARAFYANNNLISELPGMRRYFVADRNRNKVRSLVNWQTTDQLSFQGGLDFTGDKYPGSTYGLQDARVLAMNLDGTYALREGFSADVFYTYENQRSITAGNTYTANSNVAAINNGQPGVVGLSGNGCDGYTTLQQRNNNNKMDPCLNWSANMLEKVNTLGLGLRMQASKLDLTGSLIFTRQRWDNNVRGGNWANNILNGPGAAPTTIAAWFIPATPLPTVSVNTAELRLIGKYAISKSQSMRVSYAYVHMKDTDWMYEGMQFGSLSGQLPTNEQPFNFGVNVVGVSYVLAF
jgi:decaheme-associated outer membrane protein, MtrB/PioB family